VTKGQAIKWYTDPFAGATMKYDAEQSLLYEHNYSGIEMALFDALCSCSMSVITAYLQSLK
jgi:hypothetical protein